MMNKKGKRFLHLSTISVNLMSFVGTMGYSWTSPYIPKLSADSEDNPLPRPTTVLENSWITSLHNIGCMCGPIIAGLFAGKLGKKWTLIWFHTPIILSNIMLIFADSIEEFYISRFLLGIGSGCVYSVIPTYVAEICDDNNRGSASMILNLMSTLSTLTVVVIGPYVSIRTFSIIFLVPSFLFILIFGVFVPESPYEFIVRGDLDKAELSLSKLRQTPEVQKELLDMVSSIETTDQKVPFREMIHSRVVLKSFTITVGLLFFQQFSGNAALTAYQQTIFDSTMSSIPGNISVIIVNVVQLVPTLMVTYIADKIKRKKLLLISHIGLIFALLFLGLYFILQAKEYHLGNMSWLPLFCLLTFMVFYRLGLGSIPYTIMGEIFPTELKAELSTAVTVIMFTFCSIVTFTFPLMFLQFGKGLTFWIFGGFLIISTVFFTILVPETGGKSFSEIQDMLMGGKNEQTTM